MRAQHIIIFLTLLLLLLLVNVVAALASAIPQSTTQFQGKEYLRRILHQPLFPESSTPPPLSTVSPPPPPVPASPVFPNPDQPFFPEVPSSGQTPDQAQQQSPPPPQQPTNGGAAAVPNTTTQSQQTKPAKKVAIAISVGIVTLGMLSGLAFYLYKHRMKSPDDESPHNKLDGGNSQRMINEESRMPPSTFLYIGTVEPPVPQQRSVTTTDTTVQNGSPYRKLNSLKRSENRYRPSPDLQPLPPLTKPPPPPSINSPPPMSSSDEESHGTAFYTPQGSTVSNEEGSYLSNNTSLVPQSRGENHANGSVPHSKRTSPKSRLYGSPTNTRNAIIPSIKQPPAPPPAPLPLPLPNVEPMSRNHPMQLNKPAIPYAPKRPKFKSPPPPPDFARLQLISQQPQDISKGTSPQNRPPPPPPPPPPLPPLLTVRKVSGSAMDKPSADIPRTVKPQSRSPTQQRTPKIEKRDSVEEVERGTSSSERHDSDDTDGSKPKLKPLHWDKVRATSERATVWDQLKSSSFQLNEDMMESLFGCNSANSEPKEGTTRKSVLPPVAQENRVLDPKKSQNIAILLRALNVTRDEVSEALLDGNPEGLGPELLETLVKMAPTKEEEIKLRDYNGDTSRLGSAERFLKTILGVPFAFKRVEAMLYRANFDAEVNYLRKSFQTLEEASEELKNSKLFLKLLEAVLQTGNRMNVGTNRGDARAFKLDTLLKLVDIKGTDGKTTLLHFVVQEIIRSEGAGSKNTIEDLPNKTDFKLKDDVFRKQGLQVVAGLSRELGNVKKAAAMDSDVLSSYVSKLEIGLDKVRSVLQYEKPSMQGKFFESMKKFLKEAEEEILHVRAEERKALCSVKEVTEYFHGDAAKEGAHPLRIFVIVRDFLSILDNVCKEVGRMQDRTMSVGAGRSFRISVTASLPVLNRYNVRQDESSDDSLSP